MKRHLLGIFSLIFILSCGHSSEINSQKDNSVGKTADDSLIDTSPINLDMSLIKSLMTFDVLGGVFRKNSDENQRKSVSKLSISLTPPNESNNQPEASNGGPTPIDFSNQYVGYKGMGRLVISAFGTAQEFFPQRSHKDIVRHFSNLTLTFLFLDYAFNNPCLGIVQLDGEVTCTVDGDYETKTEKFLGRAICSHGQKENPKAILYTTRADNYEIEFNATLQIDGNHYKFSSYKYEGEIIINKEKGDIKELIAGANACS